MSLNDFSVFALSNTKNCVLCILKSNHCSTVVCEHLRAHAQQCLTEFFRLQMHAHTPLRQMGSLSPYPSPLLPPASMTGVKEPIVIQSAFPPPIVCDSWKPSELIETSAHSTVPPPAAVALSFLHFISLSLSLIPSPFLFPHPFLSHVLTGLFNLSHTHTQLDHCTHRDREKSLTAISVCDSLSVLLLCLLFVFSSIEPIAFIDVADSQSAGQSDN